MPLRKTPLVNKRYYHIINRSINREPIFTRKKVCQRFIMATTFYQLSHPPMRLSHFLEYGVDKRKELITSLQKKSKKLVKIISYCLMPNHYHFLLRQNLDNGISKYISLIQNSYTRYFNEKHQRLGHLFQGQFKAILIETNEQLLHLSRYIHLNPYSSSIIKDLRDLEKYQWSSFPEFVKKNNDFCDKKIILSQFSSEKDYKKFVYNNADYQRNLEKIKHFCLETIDPEVTDL